MHMLSKEKIFYLIFYHDYDEGFLVGAFYGRVFNFKVFVVKYENCC